MNNETFCNDLPHLAIHLFYKSFRRNIFEEMRTIYQIQNANRRVTKGLLGMYAQEKQIVAI